MLKKMRLGGIVLASLLTAVSCQNEEMVNNASQEGQQITIEAVRGLNSRTSLIPGTVADTYQTVWSADDKIYVTSADGRTTGVLTIDPEDAGSPEGTFTGFVFGNPSDLKYSVFPVPENGVISLNNVDAGEIDAPMIAEINPSTNEATFSNACAMVRLYITGLSEENNTVTVSATNIAGTLEPSITSSGIALNQLDKASDITITGVQNAEYFFVPVYATDTQSSVTLSVKVNNSTKDVTANILKGKIAKTNSLAVRNGELIDPSTDLNGGTGEGEEGEGDNTAAYVTTNDALSSAINNGATDLYLAEGEYTVPANLKAGQEITITGNKDTEINITNCHHPSGNNAVEINFEGVTINGSGYTNGLACTTATYTDCTFNTADMYLYRSTKFVRCTFNDTGTYALWTWGASMVEFEDCTFNTSGKALYVNANVLDDGTNHQTVKITNCKFYDTGDNDTKKAAIETGDDYNKTTYDIFITNITVEGFAITEDKTSTFNYGGTNFGTNVWGNKYLMGTDKLNVVIDGNDVH